MASTHSYGLLTIGNALVDVISHSDEAYLAEQKRLHGMEKGSMNLIGEGRAVELYAAMKDGVETSGGSAGNTMAGFASFGGKGAYIGKVADDALGRAFASDLKTIRATFTTDPLIAGAPTGRCMILVTPDGQRTMNTFLGAAVELSVSDIDHALVAASAVTYLEGYLFDPPQAKEAFRLAAHIAHEAGQKVSLTLSDSFCVNRHRDDFLDLVQGHVDILFANEDEIKSLYRTDNFNDAVAAVKGHCEVAVLTRSEKGAVIVTAGETIAASAMPTKLVDTTGAGDQAAAGFLYGYTQGMDLAACGRLGMLAASEVISHVGPRPAIQYANLIPKAAVA